MAESPDYQPIDFAPYPADPSSYIAIQDGANTAVGGPTTIQTLTDGKLYVIKSWVVSGQVVNTSTTNACQPNMLMEITRGLDNSGTSANIGFWQGQLPVAAAATGGNPAAFYLEAPTPLVVRAGSVGTPNKLIVWPDKNTGSFINSWGTTLIMWPLN